MYSVSLTLISLMLCYNHQFKYITLYNHETKFSVQKFHFGGNQFP